jgi:crotonobetainyl-CoA:carnitine CoA-transferase CaiB-like acyl-CoA transferase
MLPLEGIKILDLSRFIPGLYGTMILGDLGAEVLKVESFEPAVPPFAQIKDEKSLVYYAAYNPLERNKKSIMLNLKAEEARQVFYKLAVKSDVILEGFRPGVVKRLGIDYETINKLNPRIIYCSLSGYGQDGPYSTLPGHDPNYIAIAGALSLIGPRDGSPQLPSNFLADYAGGGLQTAIGILAAILARQKTGEGQYLDLAMLDGVVSLLSFEAFEYFATSNVPRRGETFTTGRYPFGQVYQTKDGGYITIAALEPHFWRNLCRALSREDLIPYQFDTGAKREEIYAYLREVFLTKTRDEWFEFLSKQDVPAGAVKDLDEALSDPQVIHRQMVDEIEHPEFGRVRQVGIIPKLSKTPGRIRSLGAMPGAHTVEILQDLGYDMESIERLGRDGIIGYPGGAKD